MKESFSFIRQFKEEERLQKSEINAFKMNFNKIWASINTNCIINVKFVIFATLLLQTSSSPSNRNGHVYVRLNNLTLPLKSFLQEYCVNDTDTSFQWINESIQSFHCDTSTVEDKKCLIWCIGEEDSCSDLEECCGNEYECINQICSSATSRLDFVLIVKLALVTALVVTIFAIFTLCWKGIIEPRCIGYSTQAVGDNVSLSSERCTQSHTPPNHGFHVEKPPPYEECIQESSLAWSSQEPPPYSIAANISQGPLTELPNRYFMSCTSGLSELNVQDIKLQEVSLENMREIIISSPVNNMEDFIFFSTSSSETGPNSLIRLAPNLVVLAEGNETRAREVTEVEQERSRNGETVEPKTQSTNSVTG